MLAYLLKISIYKIKHNDKNNNYLFKLTIFYNICVKVDVL